MKAIFFAGVALFAVGHVRAHATELRRGPALYCHRTANKDAPENTLDSLEQAALLGCDVIEIDIRRTLDGVLVLNHDGVLERLTDGEGTVDQSYFVELAHLDAGKWMGQRFSGDRIARFDDALRLAHRLNVRLALDIKTRGLGPDILRALEREGMMERVEIGGEPDDVRALLPKQVATSAGETWLQPGVTQVEVERLHQQGKAVIVNFSANGHEMDFAGMKAAVAAGVDGISVDFPRLGADAVGRPVEATLQRLIAAAEAGEDADRARAILALSRYEGFPLEAYFLHWLQDGPPLASHAAAVSLAFARPMTDPVKLTPALRAKAPAARANAAWTVGKLQAPAGMLVPLLHDESPEVVRQALISLAQANGDVSGDTLLPFLHEPTPAIRGAAALALARHQPSIAATAIPEQLQVEIRSVDGLAKAYSAAGGKAISQHDIDVVMASFRCQMLMIRAISEIPGDVSTKALTSLAFQRVSNFAQTDSMVAGFQLWDRAGAEPDAIVVQLGSTDSVVADRAEWALVKGDERVLPAVRQGLNNPATRTRAIRILAWHGDGASVTELEQIAQAPGPDRELAAWAVTKIQMLSSALPTSGKGE
jgi:glycerophosphoryl diester phosphodiesterase